MDLNIDVNMDVFVYGDVFIFQFAEHSGEMVGIVEWIIISMDDTFVIYSTYEEEKIVWLKKGEKNSWI